MDGVTNSQDYYTLMTAQLRNQDPFAPSDASQTLMESVQFQTLQQLQQMSRSLESLSLRTQVTEASSLIGRQVQALLPGGQAIQGTVSSIVFERGVPQLLIDGRSVPLDSLTRIG